jgi:hypothetical protein
MSGTDPQEQRRPAVQMPFGAQCVLNCRPLTIASRRVSHTLPSSAAFASRFPNRFRLNPRRLEPKTCFVALTYEARRVP